MAKVEAPLFSFGARGKLANSVVYFPWKGVNAIRSWVIPANPKTASQRTQRGRMSDAVDAWHSARYTADDVSAWNRYAGVLEQIMSGFNAMVKTLVKEAIIGNAWEPMRNCTTSGVGTDRFTVRLEKVRGGNAPILHWGTRKTHFPDYHAMTDLGIDAWSWEITGLTKDTLYYFYADVGTSGTDYGRLGVYAQRTAAA